MNRQQTIDRINERLKRLDDGALEGLLKLLDHQGKLGVSASGLPYTGDPETDDILDDPAMIERLLAHQREFVDLTPEELAREIEQRIAQGELVSWERTKAELGLQ